MMGGRGRAPTPTSLRILKGNPQHRPINDQEPKPPADPLEEPTEGLDAEGAKEWRRVVSALHACGLATSVDRSGLMGYCQLYSRWRQIEDAIKADGLIVLRPGKIATLHPLAREAGMVLDKLRQYLAEFGMTPASRSRIKVDAPKPKSKVESFREKHGG